MLGMSGHARAAIYERSLDTGQMERAGKLSSGSMRIKRQIESLRGAKSDFATPYTHHFVYLKAKPLSTNEGGSL